MADNVPREPPRSAIEATGAIASDVVIGLRQNPALLAIVVLNVIAIVVGMWFLRGLVNDGRANREHLMLMIEKCINGRGDFGR